MSWETVNFEDAPFQIVDGDRGKNYPKQNEFSSEGYCLFLSATNVTKSGFSFSSNQFVTREKHDSLRKGKVERGDVILTTRGTLGNVALYSDAIPFPVMRINSGMVTIKPDQASLSSEYLYYFLRSELFQAQVRALQSGVAQPQLPIRDIKKIKFKYPDLPTQKRIAGVLSAYDDLIENNRRRIALLKEAARLIYREWFIHFRFPNHENTKFENGLPVGWAEGQIDGLFKTSSGGTPSRKKDGFYGGSINWLKTQELNNGYIFGTDEKITEEGLRGSSAKLFPENTVVVAMYGATIGQLGLLAAPSTTNQACCALLPIRDEKDYLFGYCLMDDKSQTLKDLGQGAAQNNVSQQVIKGLKIIVPRAEVISDFNKLIEPNFLQRKTLQQQNQALTKARDLLLPRLMDGRIAV